MTDEPRREPAGEDVVRRLLAQARHTGPTPDDVAARIDAALAAEAPPTADPAPSDPTPPDPTTSDPAPADLDARRARRRRRLLPTVLAAAAVAVVAGVGLGTSGLLDGGDEATTGQGASESGAEQAPSESTPPSAPDTGDRGDDDGAGVPQERDRRGVTPDGFSAESGPGEPVVRDGPTLVADLSAALASDRASLDRPTRRCAPASLPGQRVGVRLDDARAELVAAPAADGERRVDVYTCAGDRRSPAVSATVPAG